MKWQLLLIATFVTAAMSGLFLVSGTDEYTKQTLSEKSTRATTLAQALLVQEGAALSWSRDNSAASGPISQASLVIPVPWNSLKNIRSTVGSTSLGRAATTWYGGAAFPAAAILTAIATTAGPFSGLGIVTNGNIVSANGTTIPVPPGVPNGVTAVTTLVTP